MIRGYLWNLFFGKAMATTKCLPASPLCNLRGFVGNSGVDALRFNIF
jgi:hypothetical protein